MRISELSRRTGLPVSSIKFYIRAGLLPAGERTAANQSSYGEEHVERLAAIRVLRDGVGVSVDAARRALTEVDGSAGERIAPVAKIVERRWTLSILAVLRFGPQRFVDLRRKLPGVSPNVLSTRLRELDCEGVVDRRRLPAPAASTVYELTDRGRSLAEVVTALEVWGLTA